jgi:hypothetical protein
MSGKKMALKSSHTIFTLMMIGLLYLLRFMILGQTLMVVLLFPLSISPLQICTLVSLQNFSFFEVSNLFFNLKIYCIISSPKEMIILSQHISDVQFLLFCRRNPLHLHHSDNSMLDQSGVAPWFTLIFSVVFYFSRG